MIDTSFPQKSGQGISIVLSFEKIKLKNTDEIVNEKQGRSCTVVSDVWSINILLLLFAVACYQYTLLNR